jgi:hypothetical protein
MAHGPDSAQIDLGFGNAAREVLDLRVGVRSGNLARECRNFLRQYRIGKNGQAEPVTERIFGRAASAVSSLRAGT